MPRIQSSLMILNLISKFKNQQCSDFISKQLSKTSLGKQLHQIIQEQLRNSFPDINQLAFDILIHLQRLHDSNAEPCLLHQQNTTIEIGYVAKIIAELRNSCSIATSNGLSLELLYAIHLESATEKIPSWKLIANTTIEILDMLEEDLDQFNILEACQTTPHFGLMSGVEFMLKYGRDFPKEMQNILVPKIMNLCYKATKYAEVGFQIKCSIQLATDIGDKRFFNILKLSPTHFVVDIRHQRRCNRSSIGISSLYPMKPVHHFYVYIFLLTFFC